MNEPVNNQTNNPENGTPENWQFVEIDGQQVSIDELKSGYMRQSDYTRKTQELAEQYKAPAQEGGEDVEALRQFVRAEADQVLKPELERFQQSLQSDQAFNLLLEANPHLKKDEKQIRDLAKLKWVAFEDVIEEYKFGWGKDKLNKAKDRNLVWDRSIQENPQKSISDLTPEERAERKKQQANGSQYIKEDEKI